MRTAALLLSLVAVALGLAALPCGAGDTQPALEHSLRDLTTHASHVRSQVKVAVDTAQLLDKPSTEIPPPEAAMKRIASMKRRIKALRADKRKTLRKIRLRNRKRAEQAEKRNQELQARNTELLVQIKGQKDRHDKLVQEANKRRDTEQGFKRSQASSETTEKKGQEQVQKSREADVKGRVGLVDKRRAERMNKVRTKIKLSKEGAQKRVVQEGGLKKQLKAMHKTKAAALKKNRKVELSTEAERKAKISKQIASEANRKAAKVQREAKRKQAAAKGSANEAKQKAKRSWDGVCMLGRRGACGKGWENRGTVGLIVLNKDLIRSGMPNGGKFNGGWTWRHPALCCWRKNARPPTLRGMTLLGASCPAGSKDIGTGGIINRGGSFFAKGGAFNPSWSWVHPKMCVIQNDKLPVASHNQFCFFGTTTSPAAWNSPLHEGRKCPRSFKRMGEDQGWTGIILRNNDYGRNPAAGGGAFNGSWKWMHPFVCCGK